MDNAVLTVCLVYVVGLMAVYAFIAYRWLKSRKGAWGAWSNRRHHG